jgi:eukaryotic-like serine/threonine-protein kinase
VKFLTSLRGERLLTDLKTTQDPDSPAFRRIIQKLVQLGGDIIPAIVDALPAADRRETLAYVEVLGALADSRNLPSLLAELSHPNPRVVSAISWALSSSRDYAPSQLLEALKNPDLPTGALMDIIAAQKSRIPLRDLLGAAYTMESRDKSALFRVIADVADESAVADLLARLEGKDVAVRIHLMEILARFDRSDVTDALLVQLRHASKLVRLAALATLLKMKVITDVRAIAPLIADPDMEVANKAIELLIRARHPQTIPLLLPALKHESEYARRAAVEVLNELCDAASIKYLLEAIKDSDWWVRSRAADALGKIGGPRVVDAVIALVNDRDEEIRRTAIEILNLTHDERAVDHLIAATRDTDWWVSERSVDALAAIGNHKAVPRLVEMLQDYAHSLPAVVRALVKLGDATTIPTLLPLLQRSESEIRIEALHALAALADSPQLDTVQARIRSVGQMTTDQAVAAAAARAMQVLEERHPGQASRLADTAHTLAPTSRTLLEAADVRDLAAQADSLNQRLDIGSLSPGDVLDGRYKFVTKIGKGAFGTVLLMEDIVVGERLVLKFLNPSFSQDEDMLQRFTRELRISRMITHRNVIRIYDFLSIRGNYAISMEYFPSHTLGAELTGEKPLPVGQSVRYGIDLCHGMAVAHQMGIVHRDLKPANILINDERLLKIVDFGVAAAQREGDAQLTKTGYVIGSPKYMAPEQILGKPIDPRADIYSTGVVLYEMLAGVAPYTRGDHMAIMYQHVQGKALPVDEMNPKVPKPLAAIVTRAMAVDKLRRYQSMEELSLDLERCV